MKSEFSNSTLNEESDNVSTKSINTENCTTLKTCTENSTQKRTTLKTENSTTSCTLKTENLQFHSIFHSDKNLSKVSIMGQHYKRLVKPFMFPPKLSKEDEEKLPKDWDPKYKNVIVRARNAIEALGSDEPNINYLEVLNGFKIPMPSKGKLESDSVPINESVIEFMKDRTNHEWPSVASFTGIPLEAEWVSANNGNVDDEKVIYQLHGGVYCLGSPKWYRRLGYFLSKASNAKVFTIDYRLGILSSPDLCN